MDRRMCSPTGNIHHDQPMKQSELGYIRILLRENVVEVAPSNNACTPSGGTGSGHSNILRWPPEDPSGGQSQGLGRLFGDETGRLTEVMPNLPPVDSSDYVIRRNRHAKQPREAAIWFWYLHPPAAPKGIGSIRRKQKRRQGRSCVPLWHPGPLLMPRLASST